jgi:glycosyltransferase involved in cell wall biosynthesis
MKILHVYKDYYPPVKGGIECHINLLTNGLRAKGIDVQVLVSNTKNRFQIDRFNGVMVAKVPQLGRFYSAPLTPTFHRYLKRYGKAADIIHFHHPNPTAEFSYFFTNLNKKLIVTYHSDIIRQDKLGKLYSPFRKMFLEKTDRIIATSPNYIQSSTVLKGFKHKCTVIPLGTDIERFLSDTDSTQIKKIKRENGPTPLILFVGCFRYYKGLHLLISAMKDVPAKLFLIGSGPEEFRLRNLVEKKSLDRKIFFLGELPDAEVNLYYQACDIFVLPSHLRSEAFGMVQLEAMCCRKPVISTELGTGTSFVNINQQTGIINRAE